MKEMALHTVARSRSAPASRSPARFQFERALALRNPVVDPGRRPGLGAPGPLDAGRAGRGSGAVVAGRRVERAHARTSLTLPIASLRAQLHLSSARRSTGDSPLRALCWLGALAAAARPHRRRVVDNLPPATTLLATWSVAMLCRSRSRSCCAAAKQSGTPWPSRDAGLRR